MGDLSDMNDIERVMRSPEGRERLRGFREALVGRSIVEVEFVNEVNFIGIELHLDDGGMFSLTEPFLGVDALREEFADAIRREYLIDYPERGGDAHRPENNR